MKNYCFAALIILLFSSCTNDDKSKLKGTWKYSDLENSDTYLFNESYYNFEWKTATSKDNDNGEFSNYTPGEILFDDQGRYGGAFYNFISDESMSFLVFHVFERISGYGLNGVYHQATLDKNLYAHEKFVFSIDSLVISEATTQSRDCPINTIFEVTERFGIKANLKEFTLYQDGKAEYTFEYKCYDQRLYFGNKKKRILLTKV
jgi:hypothetical protein